MAKFGFSGREPDTSGLSGSDKLMIFGAMLRDLGQGEGPDAIFRVQEALAGRQERARKDQFMEQLGGMMGPQYEAGPAPVVAPPTRSVPSVMGTDPVAATSQSAPYRYEPPKRTSNGLSLDDPRMASIVLGAMRNGVNISPILDLMKANRPDVDFDPSGIGYSKHDPRLIGVRRPKIGENLSPQLDEAGNVVGVNNLAGAVDAASDMAGGIETAKARAKAPYEFQTIIGPNGQPITVSSATAAALGASGGIIARGQSPAAAAAAKAKAEAAAGAQITLPQDLATVDAAITSIDNLSKDPVLSKRTGAWGLLPAMPGTEGVGFDAQLKQLTGQVFLDAYTGLKGAGAITEQEGKAATAAKARLEKAQSEEDFRSALKDLRTSLDAGRRRLQQRAGLRPAATASVAPAPAAGRRDAGQVYQTPKGPLRWTGSYWEEP